MKFAEKVYDRIFFVLKRILALGEFFLLLRLILKFSFANPASFVVWHLYTATEYLVWPFQGIFPDYILLDRIVEIGTVAAIIGYAIAFFILAKLLRLFARPGEL